MSIGGPGSGFERLALPFSGRDDSGQQQPRVSDYHERRADAQDEHEQTGRRLDQAADQEEKL